MAGFRRFRSLNRCRGSLRHDAGNEAPDRRAPGRGSIATGQASTGQGIYCHRAGEHRAGDLLPPGRGSGRGSIATGQGIGHRLRESLRSGKPGQGHRTRAIGPGPSGTGPSGTGPSGHRAPDHRAIGHRTIGHRTRGQGHRVVRYVSILPGQAPPTCLTDNLGRIKNTRQGDSPAGLVDCIGKR